MKTKEFIDILRASPEQDLVFVNSEDIAIHPGYHLTEIKAASYDTVDCGNQKNRWSETILQLWVPEETDENYMKAGKFMRIFDSVRASILLQEDADVRIEYGDENFFPSIYSVAAISKLGNALNVLLEPPGTTCKARDRAVNAETCCC